MRDAAPPRDPAALDDWLRDRESRYDDLVPGTERRIVWVDPGDPAPTELAVVYLHGFSATHRETASLTERVAASLDANAYLTRLTGHGRPGRALGRARAEHWFRDTAEAVEIGRRIGRRVVLLGVSTGGALDAHTPEQARYWTARYPTTAIVEVARVVRRIRRGPLQSIDAPTLMIYSPADQVVDPDEVEEVYARIPEPRAIVRIDDPAGPSSHVLAGDLLAPDATGPTTERIVTFLRDIVEV